MDEDNLARILADAGGLTLRLSGELDERSREEILARVRRRCENLLDATFPDVRFFYSNNVVRWSRLDWERQLLEKEDEEQPPLDLPVTVEWIDGPGQARVRLALRELGVDTMTLPDGKSLKVSAVELKRELSSRGELLILIHAHEISAEMRQAVARIAQRGANERSALEERRMLMLAKKVVWEEQNPGQPVRAGLGQDQVENIDIDLLPSRCSTKRELCYQLLAGSSREQQRDIVGWWAIHGQPVVDAAVSEKPRN